MAINPTDFYTLYSTSTSDTRAMTLGAGPGNAVLGQANITSTYNITGAEIVGGDALTVMALETVDGLKRYAIGGVVAQTGNQVIRLLTDIPDGVFPLRWANFATFDGVSLIRAGAIVDHNSGTAVSLTPPSSIGDMLVALGLTSGSGAMAAGAGGATDMDGGAADTLAVRRLRTDATATIAATWTPTTAWYAAAFALVPIGPASSGDASGTVTLDGPTVSGGASSNPPSTASGTMDLDGPTVSGGASVGSGTITITLRGDGNLLKVGETVDVVKVERLDGSVAVVAASRTSNGSGQIPISSASLIPGTNYIVSGWNADGSLRFIDRLQAA